MSSSRHSSQDDSPDAVDDEQLRIRIPNPKVYIQRQSLWVGRRGKPRCDSCRANNLKVRCGQAPMRLLILPMSSVTAFCQCAITVLGATIVPAYTHRSLHQPIEAFRVAIVVGQRTSRYVSRSAVRPRSFR